MRVREERTKILWVRIKPQNEAFLLNEMRRLKYKKKTAYIDDLLDEMRERREEKRKRVNKSR